MPVDLTVDDPAHGSPQHLDLVVPFVTRCSVFDARARAGLRDTKDDPDGAVSLYLAHHLQELDEETIRSIFGKSGAEVDVEALLSALLLKRVGLFPAKAEECASFDYTIGEDVTDYLLVVRFDGAGNVASVEMES